MVEAIEDLFVPVLVYNNKPSDESLLKQFGEKSWNNPVTRFLKSDATDLIKRKDRIWDLEPMAARMVEALKASEQEVPNYLKGLAIDKSKLNRATFAMHCYWVGEVKLGSIEGVTNTVSGWAGGLEVVQVTYDPNVVEYSKLLEAATSFECASKVFAHNDEQLALARKLVGAKAVMIPKATRKAKLSDQKYHLRNTPGLRSLALTEHQSTKVNGALQGKYQAYLSPRQIDQLKLVSDRLSAASTKSFNDLVFPDDDSKLSAYQVRLNKRLAETKSNPKK